MLTLDIDAVDGRDFRRPEIPPQVVCLDGLDVSQFKSALTIQLFCWDNDGLDGLDGSAYFLKEKRVGKPRPVDE